MAMVTKLMTMMMKLHVEVESDPWVRSCPMALRSRTIKLTGQGQ